MFKNTVTKWAILGVMGTLTLFNGSCDHHHGSRKHLHRTHVSVYHVNDGYCYYNTSNMMWYWLILNHSSSPIYYNSTYISTNPPTGYSWAQVSNDRGEFVAPSPEQLSSLSPESIVEETMVVDDRGIPAVDGDGNLVDPDQLNPDSPYDDNSPSDNGTDSTDSGGGDSGGGGDGGGSSGD